MLKFLGNSSDLSQCVNVSITEDDALENEYMFSTSASSSTVSNEENDS